MFISNVFFCLKKLVVFNNYKLFSTTKFMVVLAILISLRVVLGFFSINIAQYGITISIAWMPLIIVGWIFGPLTGLLIGAFTDTICYFIFPTSQWYWLYSIQEPMVGLLAGIFSFFYFLSTHNKFGENNTSISRKTFNINLIFLQFFLVLFTLLTFIIVTFWLNDNSRFQGSSAFNDNFYSFFKYLLIILLVLFFLLFEILFFIFVKKKKFKVNLLFFYSIFIVLTNTFLFSFILGPISSISYFEYVNGKLPSGFINYGYIFYLVPRVVKESLKTPLEIMILVMVIPIVEKNFELIKKSIKLKW